MKILHTADWHLGAKIEGRDRLIEQEEILNEIIKIADNTDCSVVIVSGDIYHNSVPSAQAEDLFFKKIEELSSNGDRLVLIIAGNHDDAERLGACKPLAERHNIIVVSSMNAIDIARTKQDARVRIIDAGEGFMRLKVGEEQAVIAYEPFYSAERAIELAKQDTYQQSVSKLASIGAAHFSQEAFNIFAAHLFVVGGKLYNKEEVKVGDAMAVSLADLPKAHYIALGHLHRSQQIGSNVFYPGSTIALRFADHAPSVLVLEGDKLGLKTVKSVALTSACKLVQIRVNNLAFAYKELSLTTPKDLVELTIVQDNPLSATDVKDLKKAFSNLVLVKLERKFVDNESVIKINRRKLNDKDLFIEFYKQKNGVTPNARLVEMFLEIKGKTSEAD